MVKSSLLVDFSYSTRGWANFAFRFLRIGVLFHLIGVGVLILSLNTNLFLIISWILIFVLPFNASLIIPARTWIKDVAVKNGQISIGYYRYNVLLRASGSLSNVVVRRLWFLPAGRHGHGLEIRLKDNDEEVVIKQYSAFGWSKANLDDLFLIIEEQKNVMRA